jgi:hypothetical protein
MDVAPGTIIRPPAKAQIDPDLAARMAVDTELFAQTVLKESFDEPMTYQHKDVWQLLDDETLPKVVGCAWRGFGKTTMYEAKAVKSICYRQHWFIMVVGKSEEYATAITENIKAILTTTPTIRRLFGQLKPRKINPDDFDFPFSKSSWFVVDPETQQPICFITPRGAKQQVRGAQIFIGGRIRRPTLILVDDLEDSEDVDNEDLRKKLRKWVDGDLLPCVGRKRPNPRTNRWDIAGPGWTPPWRVVYMDTLKHEDAEIRNLLNRTDWKGVIHPQSELRQDKDGRKRYYSLVPELISHEQVRAEVKAAVQAGTIDEYCREKMCLPMSPEHAEWQQGYYRYYTEHDLDLSRNPRIDRFLVVDPARTKTPGSAFTAILAVAVDLAQGRIYLRDLANERLSPKEIHDKIFEKALAFNTRVIATEATGMDDHWKHTLQNEASRRNLGVEFVWLKSSSVPKGGDYGTGKNAIKCARASTMLPYYQIRCVYHEYSLKHGPLEMQQLSYPKNAYWDAIDCMGYIPQVLEEGGRYFEPQVADNDSANNFSDWHQETELGRQLQDRIWTATNSPFESPDKDEGNAWGKRTNYEEGTDWDDPPDGVELEDAELGFSCAGAFE